MTGLAKIGFVLASCLTIAACAVGGDAKSEYGKATGGAGGEITIDTDIDVDLNEE